MDTVAVYPGSFDPITNAHLDVVVLGRRPVRSLVAASWKTRGNRHSSTSRRG